MILSAQSIPRSVITPFVGRAVHAATGMSYGLSSCGYDIRLAQDIIMAPGEFRLGSSMERFDVPADLMGHCCDKSTLARQGLSVFNTILEPGWRGFLTLELVNHAAEPLCLVAGQPIAQVVFHRLDQATVQPYGAGKYQDQPPGPVAARWEVPARAAGKPAECGQGGEALPPEPERATAHGRGSEDYARRLGAEMGSTLVNWLGRD